MKGQIKRIFILLLWQAIFFIQAYALPFSIRPNGSLPTSVPQGGTVTGSYIVRNNTSKELDANFVKYLPPNVAVAAGGCGAGPFDLPLGGSCILNLVVSGAVDAKDPNPHHHLFICIKDKLGCAGTKFSLNVTALPAVLTITPTPSLYTAVHEHYSQTNVASGGTTPYMYSVFSGSLPGWASLNPLTGKVSGTPNTAGPFNYTIRVTDHVGATANATSSGTIADALTLNAMPSPYTAVNEYYFQTNIASGGTHPPYTYSYTGTLPNGTNLNTGTGLVDGTPTTANTFNYTIRVTDASGAFFDAPTNVVIAPALTLNAIPSTDHQVGLLYSQNNVASGGTTIPPYVYSFLSGILPDWASLNTSTGEVSGTPTTAAPFDYTIRVTDASGATADAESIGTIDPIPGMWTKIGPTGGLINVVVINPHDPSIMYTGTSQGGLFKSTDSGATWNLSGNGLPSTFITTIAIDPSTTSTIYASVDSEVYKSTDSGDTWNIAGSGFGAVNSFGITPGNPLIIYAGTASGVYKSEDGGNSWMITALTADINTVVVDPTTLSTIYAGTNGNSVYISTDSGATWTNSTAIFNPYVLSLAIYSTSMSITIYAGTEGNGLYRSTDFGLSWTNITAIIGPYALAVTSIVIDPSNASNLFIGTNSGVFYSTDGGAIWPALNTNLFNVTVSSIALNEVTLFAGTQGNGIFKSVALNPWSSSNTGLTAVWVVSLQIDPNDHSVMYAGSSQGGLFKTSDGGGTWSLVSPTNWTVPSLLIDPMNSANVYAGTDNGFYSSTNTGTSWNVATSGLATGYIAAITLNPQVPTTLYASLFSVIGGPYKSINSGIDWILSNAGITSTQVSALAAVNGIAPNLIFATTFDLGIFKSTDDAMNWSAINSGLPTTPFPHITSIAIDPNQQTILYAGMSGAIYKSTDSGASWSSIGGSTFSSALVNCIAIDPSTNPATTIYAGTAGLGVYKSIDGGAHWGQMNLGFGIEPVIEALAVDPVDHTILYVGTHASGVYKFTP